MIVNSNVHSKCYLENDHLYVESRNVNIEFYKNPRLVVPKLAFVINSRKRLYIKTLKI